MTAKHALFGRITSALVAGAAGILLLAGCTGQTTIEQTESIGNYGVTFSILPERLNPPQQAALNYGFTDNTTNKPVTQLDTVYGAAIHNVLISRDLQYFQHSYTDRSLQNQYSLPTQFRERGKYYSYTLFKPKGGDLQVLTGTIQTGDEGNPPDLRVDTGPRTSYGSQFSLILSAAPIKAGTPTQLGVYASERGNPITELWPFLGAPGYLWVVDENGQSFAVEQGASQANSASGTSGQGAPAPTMAPDLQAGLATVTAQPNATMIPAQQTAQVSIVQTPGLVTPSTGYGPLVLFTHTFPHAGLYKIWAELQYRDQVTQLSWVLNVGQ